MATSDIYPAPARLVIPAAAGDGYTTGGTDLGEKLSVYVTSMAREIEAVTHQDTGTFWRDARILGGSSVISVILGENSADVIALLHDVMVDGTGNVRGHNAVKLGHLLADADYTRLVLRPDTATHDFVYFPRALVTEVGPFIYHEKEFHRMATEVVIAAFYDTTDGDIFFKGDPANFPDLV